MDRNYRAHGFEGSPFDRGEKLYSPTAVGRKDFLYLFLQQAELNQSVGESAPLSVH